MEVIPDENGEDEQAESATESQESDNDDESLIPEFDELVEDS